MTRFIPWVLAVPLLVRIAESAPANEATVAAPRIIMFYGPPLTHRIYLTDWDENVRLMVALKEPAGEKIVDRDRPHINVALFWNDLAWRRFPGDSAALNGDSTALNRLKPENGQGARFLPAHGGLPAVFDYYSAGSQPGLRRIAPWGLAILSVHGIPTRLN